jgi:uncharacterized protein
MLHVTVLAATGATGRELTRQALERGHTVTAVARNPARIDLPDSDRLIRVAADVRDPASMASALHGATIVVSGLGIAKGDKPGVLTAGARAVVGAHPERIIWMGAFGTGASAPVAGPLTRTMLRLFLRAELGDKVAADTVVLDAGGTVFHPGPLSDGPISPTRRTVALDAVPRRLFPARVSRATVAAAILDQCELRDPDGGTLVPLEH